jgi:Right handed beta helix region
MGKCPDSSVGAVSVGPRGMDSLPAFLLAALGAAFDAGGATAESLHVPAEYPTIQAAVAASADGDSIVVAAGTYNEPGIAIRKQKLFLVGAGRDATYISSSPTVAFDIRFGANVTMSGFDITSPAIGAGPAFIVADASFSLAFSRIHHSNGGGTGGGAITTGFDANISCADVHFVENRGVVGAVYVGGGGIAQFVRCRFENNVTNGSLNGAGAADIVARDVLFVDCDFVGNRSVAGFEGLVGGLHFSGEGGGKALIERCLFVGNEGTTCGAILADFGGTLTIRNCTIDSNTAHDAYSAVQVARDGPKTVLENCIVTGNGSAPALSCDDGPLTLICCDVWGNDDNTMCPGGSSNFSADPLFCGSDRWDLQSGSPCAAANNDVCGLVGARAVGCGTEMVEQTTWGRIKGIWRR